MKKEYTEKAKLKRFEHKERKKFLEDMRYDSFKDHILQPFYENEYGGFVRDNAKICELTASIILIAILKRKEYKERGDYETADMLRDIIERKELKIIDAKGITYYFYNEYARSTDGRHRRPIYHINSGNW